MDVTRKPGLDRRSFLAGSTAVLAAGRGLQGRKRVSQEKKRDYRIVFNDDSFAPILMSESLEHFLELAVDRFLETQVDALFWNVISSDVLHYPSEVAEMVGAHLDGFESADYFQWYQRLVKIIDQRPDYLQALNDRARSRGLDFFASLRMNDCHESPVWKSMDTLSRYRKEHPQFLLGDAVHPGFSTGFDFAHAPVRERRYRIVEELATCYQLDGIELDFLRHPAYFKPDEAYRNRHLITGLVRRVRALLDRHKEETGRRVRLAVRVATPVEISLRMGLDLETWIREGLPDLVIAATPRGFELSLPLEQYVEAVRDRPITLLAQMGWHQPVKEAPRGRLEFLGPGGTRHLSFQLVLAQGPASRILAGNRRPRPSATAGQGLSGPFPGGRSLGRHPPSGPTSLALGTRASGGRGGRPAQDRGRSGRGRRRRSSPERPAANAVQEASFRRQGGSGAERWSPWRLRPEGSGSTTPTCTFGKYWFEYELPVPPLRAGTNRFRIRLAHRNPGLKGTATLVEVKVDLDYQDRDDRG